MLTPTILFTCWAIGCIMLVAGLWLSLWSPVQRIYGDHYLFLTTPLRRTAALAVGYLGFGFFVLAVPFKVGIRATSLFAMAFLSIAWPVWLLQTPLGFDILSHTPVWFQSLMFNF